MQDYYRVLTGRQTGLGLSFFGAPTDPQEAIKSLGHQLDSRYRQVAARLCEMRLSNSMFLARSPG